MSGIAAIIHFDGRPADRTQIEAMTARMAHRGADGIAHSVQGSVALGQCRFDTTAESMEAALPLAEESGEIVLIFDGRVDNFEDMRRLLLGHGAKLRSRADAELVLKAYLVFGQSCAAHLDGDYAALIWDARKNVIFGLRDVMGHRPFYYAWTGNALVIASEVAPILELPWFENRRNDRMLAQYAAAEWHDPEETLWQGIKRLPPAHILTCNYKGPRCVEYWAPDPFAACPVKSEEEFSEFYKGLFIDAVRKQARSQHRISCDVSGGLDSSAVFSAAVQLESEGKLLAPGLDGYTLKFEDMPTMNDLPYARKVAEHLQRPIIEIDPEIKSLEWYSEAARNRRDFPALPNNGVIHLGIWAKASRNGSRVHLTGLGGDQWLDTSTRALYSDAIAAGNFKALVDIIRGDLPEYGFYGVVKQVCRIGLIANLPKTWRRTIRANLDMMRRQDTASRIELTSDFRRHLHDVERSQAGFDRILARSGQETHENLYRDIFHSIANEHREREAAYAGIELRSPFHSRTFVQLAYSVPPWWLRIGEVTKKAHRTALRGMLPNEVIDRLDKAQVGNLYREKIPEIVDHLRVSKLFREVCVPTLWQPDVLSQPAQSDLKDHDLVQLWCLYACCRLFSTRN